MLIPHVAQNETWDTTVYLTNPNTAMAIVTLTYTGKNSVASTPDELFIPANGSKEISMKTICNRNDVKGGYVSISSDKGLTGFALYHNLKTGNLSYAGINAISMSMVEAVYDYYLPVFKAQPKYWSGLGITNLSDTNIANIAIVAIVIYDRKGRVLATKTKVLPASGQDAFVIGADLNRDGWIKVKSDQPLAGLNFLGQYDESGSHYYLADVSFTRILSKRLLIPHVAQNKIWDTTLFVANPGSSKTIVIFTYTDKSGEPSFPYTTTIPANGCKEIPVSTIGNSMLIKGGYVTISSTHKLAAFALYNNLKTKNHSYAGINAVIDISQ